jgi:hypothetical protein
VTTPPDDDAGCRWDNDVDPPLWVEEEEADDDHDGAASSSAVADALALLVKLTEGK